MAGPGRCLCESHARAGPSHSVTAAFTPSLAFLLIAGVMDLGFFRRARSQAAGILPVALDYDMLVATLHAYQASSATARAQAQAPAADGQPQPPNAALVELLVAGPEWRSAVEDLGGSFNALYARHPSSKA